MQKLQLFPKVYEAQYKNMHTVTEKSKVKWLKILAAALFFSLGPPPPPALSCGSPVLLLLPIPPCFFLLLPGLIPFCGGGGGTAPESPPPPRSKPKQQGDPPPLAFPLLPSSSSSSHSHSFPSPSLFYSLAKNKTGRRYFIAFYAGLSLSLCPPSRACIAFQYDQTRFSSPFFLSLSREYISFPSFRN